VTRCALALWVAARHRRGPLLRTAMTPFIRTKVRFHEPYRLPQVRWGAIGVIVDAEERPTLHGHESWVRARFGDFMPWIEAWRLEQVS
jgi:hypothetical protein